MVDEHHRIRASRHPDPLVEAFRRGDLTDVTPGLVPAPSVSRTAYRELVAAYPDRGFRPTIMRAFGLRENPLRPVPMMKF